MGVSAISCPFDITGILNNPLFYFNKQRGKKWIRKNQRYIFRNYEYV